MFGRALFAGILVCAVTGAVIGKEIEISQEKGNYVMDFEVVYVLHVNMDIWTAISIPDGYRITAVIPGSPDYIQAKYIQRRAYISKTAPGAGFVTNVTIHVVTPEGMEKELSFKCIPQLRKHRTLQVNLTEPDYTACNELVSAVKAKYKVDMKNRLEKQKRILDTALVTRTMLRARPVFFGLHRGALSQKYKGAEVFVDGMIQAEGDYYIYVRGFCDQRDVDIVKLQSIRIDGATRKADLVHIENVDTRQFKYVYKVSATAIHSKRSISFHIEIWSKTFTITTDIS